MLRDRLPLDTQSYLGSVRELERLIRATPDLSNLAEIRALLAAPGLSGTGSRRSATGAGSSRTAAESLPSCRGSRSARSRSPRG